MPLLALIVLFIVVPIAELYVILKVGDAIGWLPTLPLLVADSRDRHDAPALPGLAQSGGASTRRSQRAACPIARSWTACS